MATAPNNAAAATSRDNGEPFHLLVMVDRSIDINGLSRAVGARGYDIRVTNIENPHELKPGMVTSGKWELILTPVSLAPEVLKLLKQCANLPPRIIVFGPTEDVTAIDYLELGAADVVRTQPVERLHLVVARELAFIAERRARVRCERLLETRENSTAPAHPKPTSNTDHGDRDILTGLYTRNYFIGELEKSLANPESSAGSGALVHVAIDNYRFIRDKLGIAAADLALADVATILLEVIGTNGIACRFGARSDDNVFLIMLRGIERGQLADFGERLRDSIESHESEIAGNSVKVTCSTGICPMTAPGTSTQKLIYWAALSAQIAQKKGGKRIHLYDVKTDAKATQEKDTEEKNLVADALENSRFKLVFQPIVNLCAAPAQRYEVLLRMVDESNKEIMPAQFMPSAEKSGLMPDIDRWVIRKALQIAAERVRKGNKTNFFVKISSASLNDGELLAWISSILKSERVTGDAITFELTESAVMAHPDEARLFLKGLKKLHCGTALERAGTSPGALETCDDLPLDFVKFDRSLTQDFPHAQTRQERMKKLVRASHDLKREAIAEFVQDARTLRLLWQCGIDFIQGYYLQQPDSNLGYEFSAGAEM